MSKVTLLPDYIGVVQNTSLDFYLKSTNLLNAIGNYLGELNENIKFSKSFVTTNVLSSYAALFNELNATDFTVENFKIENNQIVPDGTKMMDNTFKLFFIEKYQSLSQEYKLKVSSLIQNNNYFDNFSEDIGYITDVSSIMDNNVNPYFDIFNSYYAYQTSIPATLNNKISKNELVLLKTFGFYADTLLKKNLTGLQYGNLNTNTARTSHGTNLITDILYYQRAVANQQSFITELQVILDNISNFIFFFKQLNPRDLDPERKAILLKYTITNLEGLELKVDVLKNNLNKINLSSKQVLSVDVGQ